MERVLFCVRYVILTADREVAAIKRKYTQQEVEPRMRGRIYCNPDDGNLFVRRRTPGSWTMNMGNPWTWCVVAAIALVVCVAVYLFIVI